MELIDLGIGHPEDAILPLEELRKAATHRLSLNDRSFLQYGPEAGNVGLRAELAGFLERGYNTTVGPAELLITAGATQGLDLVLSKFTQPGDTVFVEDPTYFLALDMLRERGLHIVPVMTDEEGLNVEALERLLHVHRPTLLYTIPVFHNPTGAVLPTARRERLLELATQYNFLVVADEVYQLLGESNEIPPPLAALQDERILSLGSFSKILGPGIRLGWIQSAPQHVEILASSAVLLSGGGANPFASAVVESVITLGLQEAYLSSLRALYRRRRTCMIDALHTALPATARFIVPQGGFFVWVELPEHIDTLALRNEAIAMGVNYKPGVLFSPEGNFNNCLRLCFTFYDDTRLQLGCERLSTLLHKQF